MPFSGSTYTNVAGATSAAAGQVVQSAVWDNIHTDLATALTQVMSQLVSEISFRNALFYNGGLEVWQRGAGAAASIAVSASTLLYTADRWYMQTGANQASTVAAVTGLSNGSQLAAQIQRNSGQTGVTAYGFAYALDADEIQRLRGSKVSFSSLVKAGANWSPTNGTLSCILYLGTGAVGKRNQTPYTNETQGFNLSVNLTAGGAVTSFTGASSAIIPVTTTQAELQFTWTPTGTAGANDFFTLDDVQLEAQLSTATWTLTNFDRLDFMTQLQLCKRHFVKTFLYGTAPVQNAGANTGEAVGVAGKAGAAFEFISWRFPVSMRATPTITTFNPSAANAQMRDETAAADCSATAAAGNVTESTNATSTGNAGTVVGNVLGLHMTADAGI